MVIKEIGYGLDSSGSESCLAASSYEHGPSSAIRRRKFLKIWWPYVIFSRGILLSGLKWLRSHRFK
jgi:hypothetical protein